MNMNHHSDDASQLTRLEPLLKAQKNAFASTPMPELNERLRRLNLLHNALLTYREQIYTAIDADFSGRSSAETEMAEILPLLEGIAYYLKRLKKFMKPQRRHASLTIAPGKAEVHYQPLGVVGIVTPWNFLFSSHFRHS
jgi:coniferyl-aldehyde dehydrogenase